jgi:carbamoyl-phosphate synthase small subunit
VESNDVTQPVIATEQDKSESGTAAGVPAAPEPAVLVLEDGRIFRGRSYGATGTALGEAVFATGMTGYQETITDPSYAR